MKVKFMKSIAFSGGKSFKIGQEVDEEDLSNSDELIDNGICEFININQDHEEKLEEVNKESDIKVEDMDVKQLKELCEQMGLKGYKSLKKEELLALIDKEIEAKAGEGNEN